MVTVCSQVCNSATHNARRRKAVERVDYLYSIGTGDCSLRPLERENLQFRLWVAALEALHFHVSLCDCSDRNVLGSAVGII